MADKKMNRILVVNVNWLGDVIFSTPFIKAVRAAYPKAHIACLLHPRCKEVLESNKRIDDIIIYDEELSHASISGKIKLIAQLRDQKFDAAFILHRSFTKALITYAAGIKIRIGYATKNRSLLLTHAVARPKEDIHKVEYFLNLAKSFGVKSNDRTYEFFVEDSARSYVKGLLRELGLNNGDGFVVLCPGGNWPPKRWPKENFAKLGDLIAKNGRVKIVISGAEKDIGLAEEISHLMTVKPLIFCGRTNIKELAALLELSNAVVANDSGPMHLALAVKARVVALFGPTSPKLTGPYGDGNYTVISKNNICGIPCYRQDCKEYDCMAAIKVDDVLREVERLMGMENVHK